MSARYLKRSGSIYAGFFLFFCLIFGIITQAWAHQTAMSTLTAEIRPESSEVDLLLAVSSNDLGDFLRLDGGVEGFASEAERERAQPQMAAYVSSRLKVLNNEAACEVKSEGVVEPERPTVALFYRKTFACDAELGSVTLVNRVLLKDVGGYTHYGRVQLGDDIHTTVFDPNTPTYVVEVVGESGAQQMAAQSLGEVFKDFIWEGTLHIWLGLDHVLFVICLLLAAGSFRRLLLVVTCFTVAHSITLIISALDIMTIAPEVVEPLIALSIGWVAVEIFIAQQKLISARKRDPEAAAASVGEGLALPRAAGKHLMGITFIFGLLHGFGFSYILRDELQLPTGALVPALFSFNLGVELGQVAVVCLAFPLIVWLRPKRWGSRAIQVISALVLLISIYWMILRVFFFELS